MVTVDPQVAAVLERIRSEGLDLRSSTLSPDEARAARGRQPDWLRLPSRDMARVEDRSIPGPAGPLAIRIYTPQGGEGARPAVLFFHSGGFVFGSLDSDDPQCRHIADESACILVSVDYRLAPENKFPAAYDDAICAWHWVCQHAREIGGDGTRFAVIGASAGGSLAVNVCKHARELEGPKPGFQLIFVGGFRVSQPLPSHALRDRNPAVPGSAYAELLSQAYRRSEADLKDPRYAPLLGTDFRGMPPAMIVTAECDAFSDEGALYAEKLRDCGVHAELYCARGQVHQVYAWAGAFPEGPRVLDRGAAALRAAMQTLAKPVA